MNFKVLYLILVIILISRNIGYACFCDSEEIETANFSNYNEVFLGRILNIEKIEANGIYEGEPYTFVGTITTFDVIKKWKGGRSKSIKIYQQRNSCGIDFAITNSRWIISAYKKSFTNELFKKAFPNEYLQTDICSLNIEELEYEELENSIHKMDEKFPTLIKLKNNSFQWLWVFGTFLLILFLMARLKFN